MGCPIDCVIASSQTQPLRVISLNMLHSFPRFDHLDERMALIATEFDRLQPDIILLQEVPWTLKRGSSAAWLAEQLEMNFVYLRANGNRWTILFEEGVAILSQYPLMNIEFTELQPRAGFFEQRVALRAEVNTPWGRIPILVTHLTHGDDPINQRQLNSLIEFVEADKVEMAIIGGDFNALPDSEQMQDIQSVWIDTFAKSNPGDGGYTCCIGDLTQQNAAPKKRIDYIFLNQPVNSIVIVQSQRIFSKAFEIDSKFLWASDHIGGTPS